MTPNMAARLGWIFVLSILWGLWAAGAARAAEEHEVQGAAPPAGDEALGPGVTIQQHDQQGTEEYRVNNRVFMIKVTPSKGYPYYLVDMDGDGRLETRRNDLEPDVLVPQWVIKRWK